jgi:hypothetical protein
MNPLPRSFAPLLFLLATSARAAPPAEKELLGRYACTFTQGEVAYPAFPCVIEKRNDKPWLEKLGGSQRIKGEIVPSDEGFRFSGLFFCPFGSCDRNVKGDFRRTGAGQFQGSIDTEEPTLVKLVRK